ncbi:hypothetical protein [Kordiimonas pumila]|uniref:Uncharacterized protein n=1 Tax=Kordiimonas pumila TaxID=2161677 RepID=A0ABV7D5I8_9PROT
MRVRLSLIAIEVIMDIGLEALTKGYVVRNHRRRASGGIIKGACLVGSG